MSGPLSCTKCGNPLAVESASGLCPACAPADEPGTRTFPSGAPPAADTPAAAADPTPASAAEPDPHAPTHTALDAVATLSGPSAPPGDEPLPPDPVGFTLLCRLGKGGMGEVFRAHEHSTGKFVALKMMDPKRATGAHFERFQQEFRALANLEHARIVRVFRDDFRHAPPFFTMEELPGGTVAQRLKRQGRYEPREAVELIRKVAAAVQALHEFRGHGCLAGVIHRDIKPGNILLTTEGEPKLADFGLVKYLDAETLTPADAALGTPAYMPPEQCAGMHDALGYPADVYGLGATLYHLLTGEPPFRGTLVEIVARVLNDDPKPVRELAPDVDATLGNIVRACMYKRPEDRYQTVAALVGHLDDWLKGLEPVPPKPSIPARVGRWAKRNAVALSACALLALAGAAAVAWPKRDPERAIAAGLSNGTKQALVRDGAPVPPVRWPIRHPERAEPKPDAGFAVLSQELAVGVLLNDPGVTSYRLSGRFRQEVKLKNVNPNADATARTGLLIGHAPLDFGNGRVAHFATIVAFNDFDDAQNLNEVRRLEHEDFVRLELPLDSRRRNRGGLTLKLTRFTGAQRPWREFAVEVRPTGLTISYNGQQTVAPIEFIQKNWDANAANLTQPKLNLPAFVAPKWSPRLPLGIVSQVAWSNFDSLDIEPLP